MSGRGPHHHPRSVSRTELVDASPARKKLSGSVLPVKNENPDPILSESAPYGCRFGSGFDPTLLFADSGFSVNQNLICLGFMSITPFDLPEPVFFTRFAGFVLLGTGGSLLLYF
jgi:hypothetical protein